MLGRGLLSRVGAYAVLALGFWLLFQAFERSNVLTGVLGGAVVLVGMYLMTGVWRDTFARFGGGPSGPKKRYRIYKERSSSDDTPDTRTGGTEGASDSVDGSDQGGQLPPQ